jgi:uncharacterized phiE125 gp8 family phage protein
MSLRLITAPTDYPVTLAEVKAQCRVDGTDSDGLLNTYIAAATNYVEQYTGRALMSQVWELVLDDFTDAMLIPKGPVQSVDSVKYYDSDSILQTLDTAVYAADLVSDPSWVVRVSDQTWPTVAAGVNNVVIRFTCGYATVPEAIRAAIFMLVSQWNDERSSISSVRQSVTADGGIPTLPNTVDALLCNYRSF